MTELVYQGQHCRFIGNVRANNKPIVKPSEIEGYDPSDAERIYNYACAELVQAQEALETAYMARACRGFIKYHLSLCKQAEAKVRTARKFVAYLLHNDPLLRG